ncbi:MAG: hypothetical protein N2712_04810 [Brevinematales bacterium]|nr:hypothetical protein [Brevinematales bacterium]
MWYFISFILFLFSCAPPKESVTKEDVFVPKQQIVLSTTSDGLVTVKSDVSRRKTPLNWIQAHSSYVYYIDISPDGKLMVSSGADRFIKLWDISNLPQIKEIKSIRRLYQALWGPPVRFSEDGKYIFSGSFDFVEVFDRELNFVTNLRISDKGIQSIEVGKGKIFASDVNGVIYKISFDGKALNLEDKQRIHSEEVWKVKISFDGNYLITASLDKTSKVLDIDTLKHVNTLRAHSGPLEFVDSIAGKTALFSADSHISIWDSSYNLKSKIFDEDRKDIIVGIFDRTAKYVISGGKSFRIKIWNTENLKLENTIEWHSNDIMSLRITPNNNFLISGDRDGKIAIWEF